MSRLQGHRLSAPREGQGTTAAIPGISSPSSILAVVVDPRVRDYLLEIAVEEGYGVYCAEGALEALSVLGRERPGAVLVDLEMPSAAGARFLDIFLRLRTIDFAVCIALTSRAGLTLPPGMRVVPRACLEQIGTLVRAHFAGHRDLENRSPG